VKTESIEYAIRLDGPGEEAIYQERYGAALGLWPTHEWAAADAYRDYARVVKVKVTVEEIEG
jgi:hypothetical protein